MQTRWSGPPYTFTNGKPPPSCTRKPNSPFWQYNFTIRGETERGSTKCQDAKGAAAFVEAQKVAMRERQVGRAQKFGIPLSSRKDHKGITLASAIKRYSDEETNGHKNGKSERIQLEVLSQLVADPDNTLLSDIALADFKAYRTRRGRMLSHIIERGPNGQKMIDPNTGEFVRKKVSGASINREIELARRMWNYFLDLDFDVGKPIKWRKAIDKGAEVQRIRELKPDEEVRLFAALAQIHPELLSVVEFAMLCGQRRTAVIKLRWSDIDLVNKQASVLLKTKGEAPRPHTFPLTERMLEIVKSFPKAGPFVFTYICRRGGGPASRGGVPRRAGERYPFTMQGWTRAWKIALAEAEVDDFRFHDLRHTAATRIIRTTGNLKIVQNLLGHKDIHESARYAHASNDDVLNAMNLSEQRRAENNDRANQPDVEAPDKRNVVPIRV